MIQNRVIMHYETSGMTHKEIEEKEIIERYVLHQLAPEERLAFQEHYFSCDECFERAQLEARFIASVRQSSLSGVLADDRAHTIGIAGRLMPAPFWRGAGWLVPALAASLLVAVMVIGLWALSLRRENQLLAERTAEQSRASDLAKAKNHDLETSGTELQQQKQSLEEENRRLKEQLATAERQREIELAQLRQPDINVPVRNVYPVGDAQRSTGTSEVNRVRVPRGTRAFVLILGNYKPGYSEYRLEIKDASGRAGARREGLKPDQTGDLSVMLNRTVLGAGKYTLNLFGQGQLIGRYIVVVE
jgi:hypothetical protein